MLPIEPFQIFCYSLEIKLINILASNTSSPTNKYLVTAKGLQTIQKEIHALFIPLKKAYIANSALHELMFSCYTTLSWAAEIAMDIPHPPNVIGHIERVVENLVNCFQTQYYDEMADAASMFYIAQSA